MSEVHYNKAVIKTAVVGIRCISCGKLNYNKFHNLESDPSKCQDIKVLSDCHYCKALYEVTYSLEVKTHLFSKIRGSV